MLPGHKDVSHADTKILIRYLLVFRGGWISKYLYEKNNDSRYQKLASYIITIGLIHFLVISVKNIHCFVEGSLLSIRKDPLKDRK